MAQNIDKKVNTQNTQNTGVAENNITDSRETYKRGLHPNSISNLKQFEKGESGNPLGSGIKYQKLAKALKTKANYVSPKPLSWEEKIRQEDEQDTRTYKDKVIDIIWDKAIEGDIKYVELLAKLGCLD